MGLNNGVKHGHFKEDIGKENAHNFLVDFCCSIETLFISKICCGQSVSEWNQWVSFLKCLLLAPLLLRLPSRPEKTDGVFPCVPFHLQSKRDQVCRVTQVQDVTVIVRKELKYLYSLRTMTDVFYASFLHLFAEELIIFFCLTQCKAIDRSCLVCNWDPSSWHVVHDFFCGINVVHIFATQRCSCNH